MSIGTQSSASHLSPSASDMAATTKAKEKKAHVPKIGRKQWQRVRNCVEEALRSGTDVKRIGDGTKVEYTITGFDAEDYKLDKMLVGVTIIARVKMVKVSKKIRLRGQVL